MAVRILEVFGFFVGNTEVLLDDECAQRDAAATMPLSAKLVR